jgi:hypothetical protein
MKLEVSQLLPPELCKLLQEAATIPESSRERIHEIDAAVHKIKQHMPHLFKEPHQEYLCGCGYQYPVELGKYGCPNCCGDKAAKLVEE